MVLDPITLPTFDALRLLLEGEWSAFFALRIPDGVVARHGELVGVSFNVANGNHFATMARVAKLANGALFLVLGKSEWERLLDFCNEVPELPPPNSSGDGATDFMSKIDLESIMAAASRARSDTAPATTAPDPRLDDTAANLGAAADTLPPPSMFVMGQVERRESESIPLSALSSSMGLRRRGGRLRDAPSTPVEQGDPLIGTVIAGKFAVQKRLGSGSMGCVYLARFVTLGRPVAVKVLDPRLSGDPTFTERFHREARATSLIDHPNAVRTLDFGRTETGHSFLAMDYVEGVDLATLVEREVLEPKRCVEITRQLLAGVAAAHDAHIVHRDLKLENVMVMQITNDEGDRTEVVKVCDFGIAQLGEAEHDLTSKGGAARLTARGMAVGTPEYMSPEQAQGDPCDARSDVYSAGVILFALLTRNLPFTNDSPVRVMIAQISSPPPPPSLYLPDLEPELEAIVLKALAKSPADRFQTAREMRGALGRCFPGRASVVDLSPPREDGETLESEAAEFVRERPDAPRAEASRSLGRWWVLGLALAALIAWAARAALQR